MGLSGKVLQKVKELQVHHERLSRENKQKQLLLDNIQTSLEKQTTKYEEVRMELQSSHRELQRVQEEAQAAVTSKERLSQDLQSKQSQVCSLEGQLDAARTLNTKLTQEVKRLEAELEKLQNSSRAAETTLFSTPCWSSTSPWEFSGNKKEERHGNREGETQALHVRRLQFSDMPSSSLPRQQSRGTHHVRTPDVYSTPSAAFPWERDDVAARKPSPVSPKTPYSDALSQNLAQDFSVTTNRPNDSETHLSKLQSRLAGLEDELRVKAQMLNSIQNEVAQNKKELAAKELNLQKLRDELRLTQTRMAQEGERASSAEQKARQLQEELKCQRQNTESSRVQHQQRTKELEKQHQQDLQEFQKERLHMERQHQQEINKLNQEIAQARALHNAQQAQLDKVSLQKQAVMKEVDTLKEKLKWTEEQLQQSQKKEAQTQAKLMEAVHQAEALDVSLKQSEKKERTLEEHGRKLTEERDHTLCLLRELQEQKAAVASLQQALPVCSVAQNSSQTTFCHASQHQIRKSNPINVVKQKREEVDRRGEIVVPYPTDREPGEGIDSEHISDSLPINIDNLQSEESRLQNKRAEGLETESLQTAAEMTPSQRSKQSTASGDLQAENAALRSELRDVQEELQKRLEDLEVQRRAETEARTRLKQLSRKNANQVTEKEEQYKECKAQLENERSEVDRLKKAVAVLESEIIKERREKTESKNEEEKNTPQAKENEMIELNMQLKKELSEVKSQLVLELEERKQLEEEIVNKTSSYIELKTKVDELKVEIEHLKFSPSKTSEAEEALSAANSPITYLTLQEDELNCNIIDANQEPEPHTLCQSTNENNAAISQASQRFIQPEGSALIYPQHSPTTFTDIEESPNQGNTSSGKGQEDCKLSILAAQVQSLQKQNETEKERANQYQIKLELLQNQVTQQTLQLTVAFERQSQHISGLLVELQEKENSLLSTEQELHQCKQELSALKDDVTKEEKRNNHEKEGYTSACINSNHSKGTAQLIPDAESPVLHSYQQININSSDREIQEMKVISENEENSEMSTELLNLQRENLVLKLKIAAMTAPEASGVNKDGGSLALEEQALTALSDISVQAHNDTQQSSVDNGEHGEEHEEQPEAGCQRLDQISHLQQQVVALQTKLQALSEENQQKTQELALWKLSSESVTGVESQQTAPESSGCVTLMREDEIRLSCSSNKLQGRTLFSRLQHSTTSEPKTPPLSVLQDQTEDHSGSDKENTSPTRLNQRNDTKDVLDGSLPGRSEVKAVRSSLTRAVAMVVRSVSTQTESLPVLPGPPCSHTQAGLLLEDEEVDSLPVSPVPFGEGPQSKDTVMLSASFPIPADPASLAERIRRNRTQLSAAFDDTEYEPYGLPEVVMKGFADIPTGPSCPYIVRRGLLGTAVVPVSQKNSADAEETD